MTNKEQFETIGDGLLVRAPAKINLSLLAAPNTVTFQNVTKVLVETNNEINKIAN